jgi:hypothetical protein
MSVPRARDVAEGIGMSPFEDKRDPSYLFVLYEYSSNRLDGASPLSDVLPGFLP